MQNKHHYVPLIAQYLRVQNSQCQTAAHSYLQQLWKQEFKRLQAAHTGEQSLYPCIKFLNAKYDCNLHFHMIFREENMTINQSGTHTSHPHPSPQKRDRFIEYVKISVGSRTTYVDQTLKSLACEGQQEGEAALWSYILKHKPHKPHLYSNCWAQNQLNQVKTLQ